MWLDLLCLLKGISGGYLLLLIVLLCNVIYDVFNDDVLVCSFLYLYLYMGNLLVCCVVFVMFDLFVEEDVFVCNCVIVVCIV